MNLNDYNNGKNLTDEKVKLDTQSEDDNLDLDKNVQKLNKEICLKNFVDRLNLEIFLSTQFKRRIPFVLSICLLSVLIILEYPALLFFNISSYTDGYFKLSETGSHTTSTGIYDYFEVRILLILESISEHVLTFDYQSESR
jgi:hypothetical protein